MAELLKACVELVQSYNDISIAYDNVRQPLKQDSDEWMKHTDKCSKWLWRYLDTLREIMLDATATKAELAYLANMLPKYLEDTLVLSMALRSRGQYEDALAASVFLKGLMENPAPMRRADAPYNADHLLSSWSREKIRFASELSSNLRALGRTDEAREVTSSALAKSESSATTTPGGDAGNQSRGQPVSGTSQRQHIEGMLEMARQAHEAHDSTHALEIYVDILNELHDMTPGEFEFDESLTETPDAFLVRLKLRTHRGKNTVHFRIGELEYAKVEAEASVKLAEQLSKINKDTGFLGGGDEDEGFDMTTHGSDAASSVRSRRVGTLRKEIVQRDGELLERANCWHDLGQIHQMVGMYSTLRPFFKNVSTWV